MSSRVPEKPETYKTYVVGGVRITRQALLVAAFGTLTSAVLVAIMLWHARSLSVGLVASMLVLGLMYLAVSLYAAYVTNCALVGQCVILSWLFVGLFGTYLLTMPLAILRAVRR